MFVKKGVVAVVCLGILIALSSTVAAADGFREGYELGKEQGMKDAPLINVLWGILGGPIAYGVAAFSAAPDPSAVRLQLLDDESSEFKAGYLEGYSMARQNARLLYVGGGAALPTLLFLILAGGLL